MRHFSVTSAFVESASNSNRTGTPAWVHRPNAARTASRNAGWKFAACVGANRTRIGEVVRFSQRRSMESPLASRDRKSTRLNSSHGYISYAVFCLKKKKKHSGSNTRHIV